MSGHSFSKRTVVLGAVSQLVLQVSQVCWAGTKAQPTAPPSCQPPTTPAVSTPYPLRKVILQQIGTKAFNLPNGAAVNLNADLQTLLNTAVTVVPTLSPLDSAVPGQPIPNDRCNSHIELRSAVSTFQMDMAQVGVSFGYTPGGALGPISSIDAKMDVKIGTIAMDFSIWNCIGNQCSAVVASTASHLTTGVNLSMTIDFSSIKTGPSFVYNTPLGDILRKIMMNGISQLAVSPRLNELPWQASVQSYIPSAGILVFDVGYPGRIGINQGFEIYAPTSTAWSGVCNVFENVAYAHTTAVDTAASTAIIDQSLSSRGVQVGDVVMVRVMK